MREAKDIMKKLYTMKHIIKNKIKYNLQKLTKQYIYSKLTAYICHATSHRPSWRLVQGNFNEEDGYILN